MADGRRRWLGASVGFCELRCCTAVYARVIRGFRGEGALDQGCEPLALALLCHNRRPDRAASRSCPVAADDRVRAAAERRRIGDVGGDAGATRVHLRSPPAAIRPTPPGPPVPVLAPVVHGPEVAGNVTRVSTSPSTCGKGGTVDLDGFTRSTRRTSFPVARTNPTWAAAWVRVLQTDERRVESLWVRERFDPSQGQRTTRSVRTLPRRSPPAPPRAPCSNPRTGPTWRGGRCGGGS
jgi:hypothetical protein